METERGQPDRRHRRDLGLNNIQVTNAGTYTVEATDRAVVYLSNPCSVRVYGKPVITRQPESLTVPEGSTPPSR